MWRSTAHCMAHECSTSVLLSELLNEWVSEWWCEQWWQVTEDVVRQQQLFHWSWALAKQQWRESPCQLQCARAVWKEEKPWQGFWEGGSARVRTEPTGSCTPCLRYMSKWEPCWRIPRDAGEFGIWGEFIREVSLGKMHWDQSFEGRLGPYRVDLWNAVIWCREWCNKQAVFFLNLK